MIGAVPDVCPAGLLCSVLPSGADPLTQGLTDGVFGALVHSMTHASVWLVLHVAASLGRTGTQVRLGRVWFGVRETAMLEVGALLAAPMVAAATIGAVARQDLRRLARIYAVGIPVGLTAAGAAVAVVGEALGVVDALCPLVAPEGTVAVFGRLVEGMRFTMPTIVQLAVGVVVVLGALALWLELVVRATAIYLATFFFPLALAALIWPATAHVTKRFAEILVALIGSKFVILATLALGVSAVDAERHPVDGTITGAVVLLLAAFAPFAVLRLVPVVEMAAVGHLEGMSRRPARAAVSGAVSASTVGPPAAALLARVASGDDSGLSPAGVAGSAVGRQRGEWTAESGFGNRSPDGGEAASPGGGSRLSPDGVGPRSPGGGGRSGAPPPPAGGSAGLVPPGAAGGEDQGAAPRAGGAGIVPAPVAPVDVPADEAWYLIPEASRRPAGTGPGRPGEGSPGEGTDA